MSLSAVELWAYVICVYKENINLLHKWTVMYSTPPPHREILWCGQKRKKPWRGDWSTAKLRTLWGTNTAVFLFIYKFTCHQVTSQQSALLFVLLLQRLSAKLTNKEKEASKLAEHLDFEKVKKCVFVWLYHSLVDGGWNLSHSQIQVHLQTSTNRNSPSPSASLCGGRTTWRRRRSFQESWSQHATIWSLSWTEQRLKRLSSLLRFRSVN